MRLTVLIAALLVFGCDDPPGQWTAPEHGDLKISGLDDCRFFLVNTGGQNIHVIRCPNSSTSIKYGCGKNCYRDVTTTDGDAQRSVSCDRAKRQQDRLRGYLEADNKTPTLSADSRNGLIETIHALDDYTHTPPCSYVHSLEWKPVP